MTPPALPAEAARCAGPQALAEALQATRADLLQLWQAYAQALQAQQFRVPQAEELNLPLWELGHVGWFEEFWLSRNPVRHLGAAAPDAERGPSLMARADSLYHSSQVAHALRWQLSLPGQDDTLAYLARVRERSLHLLGCSEEGDDGLYFFRLVLMHEAMHREAWVYMAQSLGLAVPGIAPIRPLAGEAGDAWACDGGPLLLGQRAHGFAFDNECPPHAVEVAPFRIDRQPVRWREFLPFVEAGGYGQESLWSAAGWQWVQAHGARMPRFLRQGDGQWQQQRFGQWQALELDEPACHLTQHEAQAWSTWAGRRLPSEAEWEWAATQAAATGEAFEWGQVWEWTARPFTPHPGFQAHPYRDYSAPWFDGRPVLRGASFATLPLMRHPSYRNYFPAHRNDIFAGLRSCAA